MRNVLVPAVMGLVVAFSPVRAQDVAKVSQALPFASKGKVDLVEAAPAATASPATVRPSNPTALTAGGKISTDATGSASVTLGSLGTVQMERNTEIQIPSEPDAGHSLELLKGKLFLNINGEQLLKNKAGEFRLKTPASLLAVKGTRFFVDCDKKSETVGLHEGKVLVTETAGQGTAELLPGQGVTVSAGRISPPAPLSAKDQSQAKAYDAFVLTRTPLVLTYVPNPPVALRGKPEPAQYFHDGRVLSEPPSENINDWEYLRFYNFTSAVRYVNGRQVARDKVSPLSISPDGLVTMTTSYQYVTMSRSVKGRMAQVPPVLGDLYKSVHADLHFKGRAWRSAHAGRADVGPLLGLQLRLRLKCVGRVSCGVNTSFSSTYNLPTTFDAPADLPEGGSWERDCILPVKLDKTGEDSRYNLHINVYPEGPEDAAGNLRGGTAELTVLDCALVSQSR
ncbi:FecR domain-containing protein [Prosthecobacter sp.]|uniref:FecR domain-containing protein n=1 Tax=Prosthecobacter sp. TaxID=1965333 RepID=UPI003784DCD9